MQCTVLLCLAVSAWLSAHHYDPPHRDAVLAYIQHESGFNPDTIEWSGACVGQWAGVRRRYILSLGRGRCPPWQVQMLVMDRELHTDFAGFWRSANPAQHMRRHFGAGALDP
jgi:hypothetical protein